MPASSASRPNGILDLGIGDGPVLTDVYAGEEDQEEAQREMDEDNARAQPVPSPQRGVHIHIHGGK